MFEHMLNKYPYSSLGIYLGNKEIMLNNLYFIFHKILFIS